MKIATFNINNINKRLANLLRWLEKEKPDVVCLQELKTEQRGFPANALRSTGYEAVWVGERSWNGVAILARKQVPVLTRSELPGDDHDNQARYVEAAVRGILVAGIYLHNGNPQPGPKFSLQTGLVRAADGTREQPDRSRCPGRVGGRLQRGTHARGHLPDSIFRQERSCAASQP